MAERVLIVTNDGKDADYAITNQVKEYLTQAGKICLQCPKDENNAIVSEQIPPDLDYAIVIGACSAWQRCPDSGSQYGNIRISDRSRVNEY